MTSLMKLRTIRTICWIGVVADALWAIALVWPQLFFFLTGRPNPELDLAFRLTMGIGASLMAGWTLLLAWAAHHPVERRAVMLLTAIPVIAGLSVVTIIGILDGNAANLWILGKLSLLGVAMLAGYHMAQRMPTEAADEIVY